MTKKFYRHWAKKLDNDRSMTKAQYGYIKWMCANEHLLRAETVSRLLMDKELQDLDQSEAHELIVYLSNYDLRTEKIANEELENEFGTSLICVTQQSTLVDLGVRALALLAMNRVATPGQLGRYIYGTAAEVYPNIRTQTEPFLQQLLSEGLIGCERDFSLPAYGNQAKADIYYLTENGSDQLHSIAPHFNYHARPGLPTRSRIFHELCVTSARLDLQSSHNVLFYEPETEIRSKHMRERNKCQKSSEVSNDSSGGCGDFRALREEIHSGNRQGVEVEVSIRPRQKEIAAKPSRITDYYAATKHRCFLIEWSCGKRAKLVPDVRLPLTEAERNEISLKPVSIRATVSQDRINKVLTALKKAGGIGTGESIAKLSGLKPSTVSEVLVMIAEKDEIEYCDGFPVSGKQKGRNLRLYHPKDITIYSIFEFGRLLTASYAVSTGLVSLKYGRPLEPISFDLITGIMILDTPQADWPVLAVIDDPSELPERVVGWAEANYKLALSRSLIESDSLRSEHSLAINPRHVSRQMSRFPTCLTKDQILIVTYGKTRALELSKVSTFDIINVETERSEKGISDRRKRQKLRRKGGSKKPSDAQKKKA